MSVFSPLRIAVIGGGGHVGLPLSLMLAKHGHAVDVIDINAAKVAMLQRGEFPFKEEGGQELLNQAGSMKIAFTTSYEPVSAADAVILTVGTPVDEHLNPHLGPVYDTIALLEPFLRDGQTIILRSTLFPGTSERIHQKLRLAGRQLSVSFCPERILQGKAIKELRELPQIISGSDPQAIATARQVFGVLTSDLIELPMTEAEFAKLGANTWRYIKFAVANQFYMIAEQKGLNFDRIRHAMTFKYPRAADFPSAGFSAGPCLFKDTMQMAAFYQHQFQLGHAAMLINESLPDFVVSQAKRERTLAGVPVGILGMAFKANDDDIRESLAYKLRRLLRYEGAEVLCTDPWVADPSFVSLETVLSRCEVLFIGCPHNEYKTLDFGGKYVSDCWGLTRAMPTKA